MSGHPTTHSSVPIWAELVTLGLFACSDQVRLTLSFVALKLVSLLALKSMLVSFSV